MEQILYVFAKTVDLFLGLIYIAILVRMFFPIFSPEPEGNMVFRTSFVLSEIVVAPARLILRIFNIGQNSPLDFSVIGGMLLLSIINIFLPAI